MNTEAMVALATDFAELTTAISVDGMSETRWRAVGGLAVRHVPGCRWASITQLHGRRARSLGASDPIAAYLDQLQYQLGVGPCLESAQLGGAILCPDLQDEQRWPDFVTAARESTTVRSVLAIQLPGGEPAAMNFYADRPRAFDPATIDVATILAAHTAGLLTLGTIAEESHQLQEALSSNRQIGIAIGILMALHRTTEAEAFAMLRSTSQRLNRKLREVAVDVAETGALPELPASSRRGPAQHLISDPEHS